MVAHISHLLSLAALAAPALTAPLAAPQSGAFNVLALSVNGETGSADAATAIGKKLATGGFAIANVYENYNYYSELYQADTHHFQTTASDDGLATLSDFTWSALTHNLWWDQCSRLGCAIPKGFSFMRVSLGQGVDIDVYNVDSDLGPNFNNAGYLGHRTTQLVEAIQANSANRTVIVTGNFNDLWFNENSSLEQLEAAGLKDIWLTFTQKGAWPPVPGTIPGCGPATSSPYACESTTKIFFRSGNVFLQPTAFDFKSDYFIGSDGQQLPDHIPVYAGFSWQL